MKKIPHTPVHGTRAKSVPLDVLINQVVGDLRLVFTGNGYPNVGFGLLVQDLSEQDSLGIGGNLKPEGMKILLENATNLVNHEETDPPSVIIQ